MSGKTTCFSMFQDARIDRTEGIIYGVAVITEGEAKGHGIKIDHKSLETVQSVASEFPNGVKVKLRHREEGEFQSVVDSVCGVIKNFSLKGNKTIGNFHILKSLDIKAREKIFEMAEIMPDQFGFSVVFSGPSEVKDGVKYLRCQEIQSIDLADKPAANPDGLFEEKPTTSMSIKYKSGDSGEHHSECMCAGCKDKLMEADRKKDEKKMEELQTAVDKLTELVTKLSADPAPVTALSYKNDKGETVQLSGEQIATALSASTQLAADAQKVLRNSVLDKMGREGRVPKKTDGIAYSLAELQALPMDTLQILAVNSPCIPLEARAVYKGTEKKSAAADPNLKGSEKVVAALEEKYSDLETMLATPMGQTVQN